jgi:YD repeat-containing protein
VQARDRPRREHPPTAPLNSRLARIQVGSWLTLSYGYDAGGNVKAITDTTNSGQVQTFGYDALDRLITATTTITGNGQYGESYQYNAIGNITYTSRLGNYFYPASSITSTHPHAATAAGSNRYSYDNNGNMITRTEQVSPSLTYTFTQQWDVENRLSVVTNTATLTVTRFYYDGDGTRVKKVESKGGATITTAYAGAIEVTITGTQRITQAYYMAGAQRVATRVITSTGSVVYYLHADRFAWAAHP